MKTLTLYSDNEENLRLIQEVAEKMGIQVQQEQAHSSQKESVTEVLRDWHQQGGLQTIIPDPVSWQKEQRKDRNLPGRD
jgi:hypothetical protein